MKNIQSQISQLDGYLISISSDPENGWFFLEIGLPKNWVFNSNDLITCTEINSSDVGKIIKVEPNNNEIIVDDLIEFVLLIVKTNKTVLDKEIEFSKHIEKVKTDLEKQIKSFYSDLDEMKKTSFNKISEGIKIKKRVNKNIEKTVNGSEKNDDVVNDDENNDLIFIDCDDDNENYESFLSFTTEYQNRNKNLFMSEILNNGYDFISEMEMKKEIDEIYRDRLIPKIIKKAINIR